MAGLGCTPATETFASQLIERVHQLGLGHYPLAVRTDGPCALGVTLVAHDERVPPFAGWESALRHLTSDVDIEVVMCVVDHSCFVHHHIVFDVVG